MYAPGREDLSRRERLFGSLKRRLELAEGRKIDEGELWATAGPDVAELEARCKAAQAEAESVLAQGARECEALEEQVQGYRSEREALEAELAEERRSSAERRKEDKAQWEEERKMSEERQSQACARVQEVQSALEVYSPAIAVITPTHPRDKADHCLTPTPCTVDDVDDDDNVMS